MDAVIGCVGLAHGLERRMSDSSRVGRSKMDEKAHNWREKILSSWWIAYLLIMIFLGGSGYLLWTEFFRR